MLDSQGNKVRMCSYCRREKSVEGMVKMTRNGMRGANYKCADCAARHKEINREAGRSR